MATNAYCVKCKAKRDMRDESKITMKNGKPATQGTCPVCGTKMFKIGGLTRPCRSDRARARCPRRSTQSASAVRSRAVGSSDGRPRAADVVLGRYNDGLWMR